MSAMDRHSWFSSKLPWFIGGMLQGEDEKKFLTHALDCANCSNILVIFFEKNSNDPLSVGHIPAEILTKWPESADRVTPLEKKLTAAHLDRCEECRGALEMVRSVFSGIDHETAPDESMGQGSTAMLAEILEQVKKRQGNLGSISRASLPQSLFEEIEEEPIETVELAMETGKAPSLSVQPDLVSGSLHPAGQFEGAFRSPRRFQSGSIEVAATTIPCQEVAVDVLDVFELPGGRVGFLHVDVPGRGMDAIRNAAMFQGVFASQKQKHPNPAETMRQVGEVFARLGDQANATRVFYGVIASDGELSYCSAGHNAATLVRKNGDQEELRTGGPPIGTDRGTTYSLGQARLDIGDTLLVLSDALLVATPAGEAGAELESTIASIPDHPTMAVLESISLFLSGFHADEGPLADDMSILVLKRN
jgi:hypothetical protein